MLGQWVWAILVAITGCIAVGLIMAYVPKKWKAGSAISTVLLAAVLIAVPMWWLYGTESGKRQVKNFISNVSGGVQRVVSVYDMQGDLIKSYTGKFDVEYDSDRIIFDDENGKRHIIYYSTGTVIIDEQ